MDEQQCRRAISEAALEEWYRLEARRRLGSKPLAGVASSQVSGSPEGGKGLDVTSSDDASTVTQLAAGEVTDDVAAAADLLVEALGGVEALRGFRTSLRRTIRWTRLLVDPARPEHVEARQALQVWEALDVLAKTVQDTRGVASDG